jgi:hypothetical protein
MTRASAFLVGVALVSACQQDGGPAAPSDGPALSAAVTQFRDRVVIRDLLVVENPCANEDVGLHLNQLFMIHEVSREGKFFHGHITFLDRGTRGTGIVSGATYRQTGAEQETLHLKGQVGVAHTIEVTVNLIGQGRAPNFTVHEIFRFVLTPAGQVRLQFDNIRQACHG